MGTEQTANTHTIDLLAILPRPPYVDWSEGQVRGTDCLFDGVTLTTETAIDLGVHKARRGGDLVSVFPRGCKTCVKRIAYQELFDHAPRCEQCTDDPACCKTGQILRRLSLGRMP